MKKSYSVKGPQRTTTSNNTSIGTLWDNANVTASVDSNFNVNIDTTINTGKGSWNLEERFAVIERLLNIPDRDYELEEKFPHLTELFNEHINNVKAIVDKIPEATDYNEQVKQHRVWQALGKNYK